MRVMASLFSRRTSARFHAPAAQNTVTGTSSEATRRRRCKRMEVIDNTGFWGLKRRPALGRDRRKHPLMKQFAIQNCAPAGCEVRNCCCQVESGSRKRALSRPPRPLEPQALSSGEVRQSQDLALSVEQQHPEGSYGAPCQDCGPSSRHGASNNNCRYGKPAEPLTGFVLHGNTLSGNNAVSFQIALKKFLANLQVDA